MMTALGRGYATASTDYTMYVNRDYANSRGVTLSVTKRPSHLLSLNFAYTFQVAEGINSTDPVSGAPNSTPTSRLI